MSNNKIILTSFIFIILGSFIYLSWRETKQARYSGWWAVEFQTPENTNLTFVIENYTNNKNFHYTVFDGENKVLEGDAIINKGEKRELDISSEVSSSDRVKIEVTNGGEKKEIYKSLNH